MAVAGKLMTVEEFSKLPEDSGPVYHELRHGEIVPVTRPKLKHSLIQRNARRLLEPLAEPATFVGTTLAFRPLPEYELWVAHVAYLSRNRFRQVDPEDYIRGAPDVVIEILSPSNTASEIYEKEKLCLENGCMEFWVVDPDRSQVKVSTPDGRTLTYHTGQEIPLPLLDTTIPVDDIFV